METSPSKVKQQLNDALLSCQDRLEDALVSVGVRYPQYNPRENAGFEVHADLRYGRAIYNKFQDNALVKIREDGHFTVLELIADGRNENEFYENLIRAARNVASDIQTMNLSIGIRKKGKKKRKQRAWSSGLKKVQRYEYSEELGEDLLGD